MDDELIKLSERDEIERYVASKIHKELRPWVFSHTYQSIMSGVHNHRRKQLYLGESQPISVQEWIALYWEKGQPE